MATSNNNNNHFLQVINCEVCDKAIGDETLTWQHIEQIHALDDHSDDSSDDNQTCRFCAAEFGTVRAAQQHIMQVHISQAEHSEHANIPMFVCNFCGIIIGDSDLILHHLKQVHTFEVFERQYEPVQIRDCRLCNATIGDSEVLMYHLQQVHLIIDDSNSESSEEPDLSEDCVWILREANNHIFNVQGALSQLASENGMMINQLQNSRSLANTSFDSCLDRLRNVMAELKRAQTLVTEAKNLASYT
jgi:hypothetical protein